jgi:hypothetical protein
LISAKTKCYVVLAGLKSAELAELAGIDTSTISRLEGRGRRTVGGHAATVDAVRHALLSRGVEIGDDGVHFVRKVQR